MSTSHLALELKTALRVLIGSGALLGDLRTRQGRRAEIINQIKEHGGWSVFWITEHRLRAIVATDMAFREEIKVTNREFPWSDVCILPNGQAEARLSQPTK